MLEHLLVSGLHAELAHVVDHLNELLLTVILLIVSVESNVGRTILGQYFLLQQSALRVTD